METKKRDQNQTEVVAFLQKHVAGHTWQLQHPPYGTGQETYFAKNQEQTYFIKLGAEIERYQIMSDLGFAPAVIATGFLEAKLPILVQKYVAGSVPSWRDFQTYWRKFAVILRDTHQNVRLQQVLSPKPFASHRAVGLASLAQVEKRWCQIRPQVPSAVNYVDAQIAQLKASVSDFSSEGLVASHNDICNGNWLVTSNQTIYLLDYESMTLDDPALDLGALLWWYYPPTQRLEFLKITGYGSDEGFSERMRIRMAIHNLNIILPRPGSFDRFVAETFDEDLVDFRAVIAGRENPQGYHD